MSRRPRIAVITVGVLAFVVVSALLARVLTVGNAERTAMLELARAEAHADEAGVLRRVSACRTGSACRARLPRILARVSHPGRVRILRLDGPSGVAIAGRSGTARLAWKAGDALPIVQCFRLRTEGNPLQGYRVRVVSIADPIKLDASC
ncbi:MAG: hypothetical protein M3Z33_04340 [Actinomycetota bacterium]|nr:hypothetical protein [Actinomycetota bacterium]